MTEVTRVLDGEVLPPMTLAEQLSDVTLRAFGRGRVIDINSPPPHNPTRSTPAREHGLQEK